MRFFISATLVAVATATYLPWDPRSGRNTGQRISPDRSYAPYQKNSIFGSLNRPQTPAQAEVNEIKRLLLVVEQRMQQFCRKHTNRALTEAYEANYYRLQANLTGCKEDGLDIRAGPRLVAVQAKDPHCDYIALRRLPDGVDASSAFWRFDKEQLDIMFPYTYASHRCGRVISDTVHTLLKIDDEPQNPSVGGGGVKYNI